MSSVRKQNKRSYMRYVQGWKTEEFPPDTLTEQCEHPSTICLRYVVMHATAEKGRCPHEGCGKEVNLNNFNLKWFKAILDEMFLDYNEVLVENQKNAVSVDKDVICVSTMWVEFKDDMTLQSFKEAVRKQFSAEPKLQILLFNGLRLKEANKNHKSLIPTCLMLLAWSSTKQFVQLIDWNHSNEDYYQNKSVKKAEGKGIKPKFPNLSAFSNPSLQFYEASIPDTDLYETTFVQDVIMCYLIRQG
ncbi:hypothetical protein CHS0354_010776 [Potamilus streckersoni]|uniref:Ubiquitin-like domain-containing protein n=1 Tax=Potamilus streckersoni TaxID=2493646 RepID=A0AAE0TA72_9BIVA|nr:hypothetical protein CHS0354_010776 [Potamilus streckersoni]